MPSPGWATLIFNMKVIFTDNVTNVAARGDVKNVKPGFFRNYLQPFKKALLATEPLLREWEERRKRMLIAKEQLKAKMAEIARRFENAKVRIEKKVTKKSTLYGGVKALDIVKALHEQFNIEIPENAVLIEKPIKSTGTYQITLTLAEDVKTQLTVEVCEKK